MPQLLDVGHDQARCYRAADFWVFSSIRTTVDNAANQPDETRDYHHQNPADNLEHRNIWSIMIELFQPIAQQLVQKILSTAPLRINPYGQRSLQSGLAQQVRQRIAVQIVVRQIKRR